MGGYEDQKEAKLVQQMTPGFLAVDELDKGPSPVSNSTRGERGHSQDIRTQGGTQGVVTLLEDM